MKIEIIRLYRMTWYHISSSSGAKKLPYKSDKPDDHSKFLDYIEKHVEENNLELLSYQSATYTLIKR